MGTTPCLRWNHGKVDVEEGKELESKLAKGQGWNLNQGSLALKPKFWN